jgi:uncharacterized damage-inducible protein DinB
MSRLELYRELYAHEKDGNEKMLAMLGSVPEESRRDARFQQAVSIAGHLIACRLNWLNRIQDETLPEEGWYDETADFAALRPRFAVADSRWTDFLVSLDQAGLAQEFEFAEGEERFRLPVEVQTVQLFGHASYHRGQVALLVDQLGGEILDTDYVDWWWTHRKEPIDA